MSRNPLQVLVVAFTLLIVQLAGGVCEAGKETKDRVYAEPKEDFAVIYFVRKGSMIGGARTLFVYSDAKFVGVLDSGSYNFGYVAPGTRLLWANGMKRPLALEVEAGETHYIQLFPRQKVLDPEEGERLIHKVKYSITADKERRTSQKHILKQWPKVQANAPQLNLGGKYCAADNNDLSARPVGRVAILPFRLTYTSPYPQEVTDEWEQKLPTLLAQQLERQGVESVSIVEELGGVDCDTILEGQFTGMDKGSNLGRIMSPSEQDAAYMRINLKLKDGKTTDVLAEYDCARAGLGGMARIGGPLQGGSKSIMNKHMKKFAQELAGLIAAE